MVTGGTKPLKELIAPTDLVTIVISDMTRFWMRQDVICELLVKYLHDEMGVDSDQIAARVALGNTPQEYGGGPQKIASEFVYDHVEESVTDHDCDASDLVYIGTTTSFGTRVSVNPLAVGRKVICIGGTVHHLMAGYGGGRKSIVPGIASRETIRMNHERALIRETDDGWVSAAVCENNPINLDMREAGAMVHVMFGINIVVDTSSRHSGLFCGEFDKAWQASCSYVQKGYGLPIDYQADVVIASCGGFPKDLNFYQSTKTLFNALRAVKEGENSCYAGGMPGGKRFQGFLRLD